MYTEVLVSTYWLDVYKPDPYGQVYNFDLEANYTLLKEYVLEVAPAIASLVDFETAFLLLSISLNIHGETVYHMRGGKGKCREPCMHHDHFGRADAVTTSVCKKITR